MITNSFQNFFQHGVSPNYALEFKLKQSCISRDFSIYTICNYKMTGHYLVPWVLSCLPGCCCWVLSCLFVYIIIYNEWNKSYSNSCEKSYKRRSKLPFRNPNYNFLMNYNFQNLWHPIETTNFCYHFRKLCSDNTTLKSSTNVMFDKYIVSTIALLKLFHGRKKVCS